MKRLIYLIVVTSIFALAGCDPSEWKPQPFQPPYQPDTVKCAFRQNPDVCMNFPGQP
jgi:hypothetical protein